METMELADETDLEHELVPLGQPYKYSDLEGPKIRILFIESNTPPLRGRLECRDVGDNQEYRAVSYVWSQNVLGPRSILQIEDQIVEIGDNLSAFIQSLDNCDLTTPLWIDSVCINQHHEAEKVHQIPLMEKIYSNAVQTLIWLGSACSVVEEACKALPEINMDLGEISFDPKTSHLSLNRSMPNLLLTNQEGICSLMIRTWFVRLWTMQEYILAQKVTFMCGRATITDATMMRFIYLYDGLNLKANEALQKPEVYAWMFGASFAPTENIRQPENNALVLFPKLQALRNMRTAIPASASVTELFKSDLAVITSTFEKTATVAEDSILGLLALLRNPTFQSVPISVEATEKEMFTGIVAAALMEQDSSENLTLLHYTDTESRNPKLPSWVPNFNSALRLKTLSPFNDQGQYLYKASQNFMTPNTERVRVDGSTLSILGRIIDEVIAVIPGHSSGWQEAAYATSAGPDQQKWEEKCSYLVKYHARGDWNALGDTAALKKNSIPRNKPIQCLPQSYISTLVAGSTIMGKSCTRSIPTPKTYWEFKKRLSELSHPEYDTFFHRMHHPENPGVKVNWDLLTGKETDRSKPLYIAEEKEEYHARLFEVCRGRSFFVTRAGRLGIGGIVKAGDKVSILACGRTPFVLRKKEPPASISGAVESRFELIGEAYVHGVMDGEAYGEMFAKKYRDRWISLE